MNFKCFCRSKKHDSVTLNVAFANESALGCVGVLIIGRTSDLTMQPQSRDKAWRPRPGETSNGLWPHVEESSIGPSPQRCYAIGDPYGDAVCPPASHRRQPAARVAQSEESPHY